MAKKDSLDGKMRGVVHEMLDQQPAVYEAAMSGAYGPPPPGWELIDNPAWRSDVIDLFTKDARVGGNRVKPRWDDDIPEQYYAGTREGRLIDSKGTIPSYYEHRRSKKITFFDVFKERYDHMSDREKNKFIKKHYKPDDPVLLLDGITPVNDNDGHIKEYLTREVRKLDWGCDPDWKFSWQRKALHTGTALSCIAAVVFYFAYGDRLFNHSDSSEQRVQSAVAYTPRISPKPAETSALVSVPQQAAPVQPSLSPLEAFVLQLPPELQSNSALYQCTGETYTKISRTFSGSGRYAKMIKDYNRQNVPGFDYHSNRCAAGSTILLPPRMIQDILQPQPPPGYVRHEKRGANSGRRRR